MKDKLTDSTTPDSETDQGPEAEKDPETYRREVLNALNTPDGYKGLLMMAEEDTETLMEASSYIDQLRSKEKIKAIYTKAAEANPVVVYNNLKSITDPNLRNEIEALAIAMTAQDE